ncbi:hypothetical protein [Janthinobacterium sp. ROICE36]|uniref:hypothetical protein n=1 Tax=Janthinobacterium sp. ROICE36 TaxID=2048670 RepID=UPI0021558717|nr:hypothetical protein [Janthinobacterium sp. ROICE36]
MQSLLAKNAGLIGELHMVVIDQHFVPRLFIELDRASFDLLQHGNVAAGKGEIELRRFGQAGKLAQPRAQTGKQGGRRRHHAPKKGTSMAPRAITAWAADQVDCQNIKIHAHTPRHCRARGHLRDSADTADSRTPKKFPIQIKDLITGTDPA